MQIDGKIARLQQLLNELNLEVSVLVDFDDGSHLIRGNATVLLEINFQTYWANISWSSVSSPRVIMAGTPPSDIELVSDLDFLKGGSNSQAIATVQAWLDRGNFPKCLDFSKKPEANSSAAVV